MDPDRDIEVTVDDGILTIAAQRRESTSEKSDGDKDSSEAEEAGKK